MESSTTLKLGDYICLFSEDAQGFVYTDDTSIKNNGLKVHGLHEDDDFTIPDVQVVTFQVMTVNRYNLNKQYRKLCKASRDMSNDENKVLLEQAKAAAEAEEKDNQAEQSRLLGRPLRYGDLVQLRHVFTNKYVMVSSKESSTVDKNKILIRLNTYNSKNAQFKFLPGFKVKMEGEQVELGDQIIFESLKSGGNYIHVTCDNSSRNDICEVNCGIDKSVFTVIKHYSPAESIVSKKPILRGGSVLQFHHKDLDAYIAAQGVCGETLQKDAHLRIQSFGSLDSRSMYPPKDADTYWQIVLASSPLIGQYVKWEETFFHLRHMATRLYLAVSDEEKPKLVPKVSEGTLFTFHTLLHGPRDEFVHIEETVRLFNEESKCWIYGVSDIYSVSEDEQEASKEISLETIQWEDSPRIQLLARAEKKYPDAFIVHAVSTADIHIFNYIVGLAPFLHGMRERMNSSTPLTTKEFIDTEETLDELKQFIEPVKRDRDKCKQNTMRGAGLIDLLVGVLKCDARKDMKTMSIFRTIYEVLFKYSHTNTVENNLYCAPFLSFFTSQLLQESDVGYRCCLAMIELIKNNRVVIDRINPARIKEVIGFTRNVKNHYILDLLGTVCVCDDIAITENQNIIAETLILEHTECMFHIQLGKEVGEMRKNDLLFISTDNRETWIPLYRFVTDGYPEKTEEGYLYLEKQIQLIKKLVHGHNPHTLDLLTKRREILPWEVVFQGLTSGHLPDTLKTMFCDMVIWLFVEGSRELPTMSHICTNFIYRRINSERPDMDDFQVESQNMDEDMPGLRHWMYSYLSQNTRLVKSEPQRNLFIAEITLLLHSLIQYQYIGTGQDIHDVKTILFQYVSGIRDAHVLPQNKKDYTRVELEQIMEWSRSATRYAPSTETDAMMNAKLRCLDLLELLMTIQTHRRLKYILAMFKDTHNLLGKYVRNESHKAKMVTLIQKELSSKELWSDITFKKGKKRKHPNPLRIALQNFVSDMQKLTDIIDPEVSDFLMELTNYQNLKIRQKVISLLNKFFSSKLDMLNTAFRSQIITSLDSERIQHEADSALPIMMKVARSKGELDTMQKLCHVLQRLISLCCASGLPEIPCIMSQNIFVNNGFLAVLLTLATVKCEPCFKERYILTVEVATKCLQLLQAMAKGNSYVQQWIFDHLSSFLFDVTISGPQCASTLTEAFKGNHKLCSKVFPNDIEEIVRLGGKTGAVEWLTLLKLLVKDECTGKIISRNQSFVIKMLMQNFTKTGYPLKKTNEQRMSLLLEMPADDNDRRYYIELVDMLAACAQGSTGYIVSVCQKLLPVTEILTVLNHEGIHMSVKAPFASYLARVYLFCTEKEMDHVVKEVFLDINLWDHVALLSTYISRHVNDAAELTEEPRLDDGSELMDYMLKSGFSFLLGVFSNCHQFDCDKLLDTNKAAQEMEQLIVPFCRLAVQYCNRYSEMVEMEDCLDLISKKAGKIIFEDGFYGHGLSKQVFVNMRRKLREPPAIYVKDANEMDLNKKLKVFTSNLIHVVQGENTVAAQLNLNTKRLMSTEYVSEYSDTPLPLGKEFHKHIHCFGRNDTEEYEKTSTLLELLEVSSLNMDTVKTAQHEIDLKCLQILRALLYNLISQLPPNWEDDTQKWKKLLVKIKNLQNTLSEEGIVKKVMPLMDRSGLNIGKEVFCLLDCLLFNANRNIQKEVYDFFTSTKEECFFRFIRNRLHLAMLSLKERRVITPKVVKQAVVQNDVDPATVDTVDTTPENQETAKSKILACFKFRNKKQDDVMDNWIETEMIESNGHATGKAKRSQKTADIEPEPEPIEDHVDHTSKSDVEIVLSVIGKLCDGQNKIMQDYLRQQPDNVLSVNIVAELTQFVGVMYTRVTSYTIKMCTNLFATLHEMSEGNQENRSTLIDNKIVDYLNFLLRRKQFHGCDVEDVLNLRSEMAGLILALMEENGVQETVTAKDVCETIAVNDILNIMTVCYAVPMYKLGEASIESGMNELELQYTSRSSNFNMLTKKKETTDIPEVYEKLTDIGYLYYNIIARMADIDKTINTNTFEFNTQRKAFQYFKSRCRSVELMKDGHLQKKHFRVRNSNLLREEVKEHVKWEVDRSSPTSKLRDLLGYSKDILKDIDYQKKLQNKKFLGQLATKWVVWHYLCILLSLSITILMLVTWKSPFTAEDLGEDIDTIPDNSSIYQKEADYNHISRSMYHLVLDILGGIHCFCSAMLLFCYLLLYHPAFPHWFVGRVTGFKMAGMAGGKKKKKVAEKKPEVPEVVSKLEVKFFSTDTLYYVTMLVMSFLGIFYHGYFFAFHLLGIVNINPLLKGVIKAITYNGRSLIWVAILGVIVIYIYTLFVFAFFRQSVLQEEEFFCKTLSECFVSVLRYGTIGDITDMVHLHEKANTFAKFGYLTLYQVTFFILFTTIGLNIIFGIIVDTFSEIRDKKWVAEKDMNDVCFICSKDSFDFEHHGKGFFHHVHEEHNMWDYVFYLIYLQEKEEKDYTSIDMHVARLTLTDGLDFFPMNCALGLSLEEDDAEADALATVTAAIENIQSRLTSQEETFQKLLKQMNKRRINRDNRSSSLYQLPSRISQLREKRIDSPSSQYPSIIVDRSSLESGRPSVSSDDMDYLKPRSPRRVSYLLPDEPKEEEVEDDEFSLPSDEEEEEEKGEEGEDGVDNGGADDDTGDGVSRL